MNSGNQPKPKYTKEFIAGIVISLALLPTMLFLGFYTFLAWGIFLIIFIVNKQYNLVKGMAIGVLVAIFVFLIVCGGFILSYS